MSADRGRAARLAFGVLLVLTGGAATWAAMRWIDPAPAGSEDGADAEPEIAPADLDVAVQTARVELGDLPIDLVAMGIVEATPDSRSMLSSRAGGRVEAVLAQPGDTVARGQVLLRFERAPVEAVLTRARAESAVAASALADFERFGRAQRLADLQLAAGSAAAAAKLARQRLAGLEPLVGDHLVAEQEIAEARAQDAERRLLEQQAARALSDYEERGAEQQLQTLRATADAAAAAERDAAAVLTEVEVCAPAAGRITELTVQAGTRLDPGAPLGALLVGDGRQIVFALDPASAAALAPGAGVRWRAGTGEPHTGHVVAVLPAVDPTTGLVPVRVAPASDAQPPPPGLYVRGELERGLLHGALLLPEHAVLRADDTPVVVVVRDGHARVVPVEVRGRHEGRVAVVGALRAGETVVVQGGYNLPDGALVHDAALPGSHP